MNWIITGVAATVALSILYMLIRSVIDCRSYGERVNWSFIVLAVVALLAELFVLVASTLQQLGKI